VNQEAATLQRPVTEVRPETPFSSPAEAVLDGVAAQTVRALPEGVARFLARAPVPMDVLGGIGEFSGGTVLAMPLADSVCVCTQRRTDGRMVVLATGGGNGHPPCDLSTSDLYAAARMCPRELGTSPPLVEQVSCDTTRYAAATLVEMLAAGLISDLAEGLSIAVGCASDAVHPAAFSAALMRSVTATLDHDLPTPTAGGVYQQVENHWFGRPVGRADVLCSLLGQAGTLFEIRCDSWTIGASHRPPGDWRLMGVHCGVVHPDAVEKYARARTATFMGRLLMERILRYQGMDERRWNGHVAHLNVVDYVEKVRDRIPTKIKGSDFLARFGETGDPLTRVDPSAVYKVRSRTEHHIYEQVRIREFIDAMSRAARKGNANAIVEAGEQTYASHWSYGQRCGLGSVETDALASAIRGLGSSEIFGAKTTGHGSGGVLAVLMRATESAREDLDQALRVYQQRTGRTARPLWGSASGALVVDVQRL